MKGYISILIITELILRINRLDEKPRLPKSSLYS
jgi:hypothetical protein